jgi:hypothetical protein
MFEKLIWHFDSLGINSVLTLVAVKYMLYDLHIIAYQIKGEGEI